MRLRRFLLAALLLFAASAACDEPGELRVREQHVLDRIGYGPDPWSRQRIRQLGVRGYIEEQLHPERLDDLALETRLRSRYPSLSMTLAQLLRAYDVNAMPQPVAIPRRELANARVLRAIHSRRQLEQVLVELWFDHFNVDARNALSRWAVIPYERDAIRPHVLGRFEDLLRAVVSHPAMLDYLSNARSFRDGFVRQGRVHGVIENFARELLELHTVGRETGFSQADVRGAALVFTGWSIRADQSGFEYVASGHDGRPKATMGLSFSNDGGLLDGHALIHHLARHPSTAYRVARMLCRAFVAESPPSECTMPARNRYLATDGDLREVLRTILLSQDFLTARYRGSRTKQPLQHLASLARLVGVDDEVAFVSAAIPHLRAMGADPYGAASPAGWPEASSVWNGEGLLLKRAELAMRAIYGSGGWATPRSTRSDAPDAALAEVIERYRPGGVSGGTYEELRRYVATTPPGERGRQAAAALFASPEFQRH